MTVDSGGDDVEFARSSVVIFLFTVFGMGAKYGFVSLATKLFPQSVFGKYSLALSLTTFFAITSTLGLQVAQDRFIPVYRENDNLAKVRTFIVRSFTIAFILLSTISLVLYFFSGQIADVFGEVGFRQPLRIFSVAVVALGMLDLMVYTFRGFEKPVYQAAFRRFGTKILPIAIVLIFLAVGQGEQALYFSFPIATVILLLSLTFIFYITIFRKLPSEADQINLRRILNYSWPFSISKTSAVFLAYADVFFIGYYLQAESVAIYRVAILLSSLILLPLRSMNPLFKPLCSRLYNTGELTELRRFYDAVARWGTTLSFGFVIVYLSIGKALIGLLFTPSYSSGFTSLVVLALASGFVAFLGPSGTTLQAADESRFYLGNSLLQLSLNVVLNILLIPVLGILGAAVATGSTRIVGEAHRFYKVRQRTGVAALRPERLKLLGVIALSSLIGIVVSVLFAANSLVRVLGISILIGAIYLTLLTKFVFGNEDIWIAEQFLPASLVESVRQYL